MASYDPKRSRPVTDVDAGPSQVDALLDAAPNPVVDLRNGTDPAGAVPASAPSSPVATPAAAGPAPSPHVGPTQVSRSPIEPVRGPDPRSRRLVTALVASGVGIGIVVIVIAVRRSRRA